MAIFGKKELNDRLIALQTFMRSDPAFKSDPVVNVTALMAMAFIECLHMANDREQAVGMYMELAQAITTDIEFERAAQQ